jgi:NAD(P)H-dependent FMN reductase
MLGRLETRPLNAIGICASPSPYSSTARTLLVRALLGLRAAGASVEMIQLARIPAASLLGRETHPDMDRAVHGVLHAEIVLIAAPVERVGFGSLLQIFLEQAPGGILAGKVCVALSTGAEARRPVAFSGNLESLLWDMGANLAAHEVYGSENRFPNGSPEISLIQEVDRVAAEALRMARRVSEGEAMPRKVGS